MICDSCFRRLNFFEPVVFLVTEAETGLNFHRECIETYLNEHIHPNWRFDCDWELHALTENVWVYSVYHIDPTKIPFSLDKKL